MSIGTAVRARLGRFETPAAEAYRSLFIDLEGLVSELASRVPAPRRVLEIGCGDGSTAEQLHRVYPTADYVGIDVAPEPGRRFGGDPQRAWFASMTSAQLREGQPDPFDLIVIVDVLHHIPAELDRHGVLADAAAMAGSGATIVIKEWASDGGPAHGLAWFADRYISGDRTVRFGTTPYLRELATAALPGWFHTWSGWVRPWRNNVLFALEQA